MKFSGDFGKIFARTLTLKMVSLCSELCYITATYRELSETGHTQFLFSPLAHSVHEAP